MKSKIKLARNLRKRQTSAEKIVWFNLRNRRMGGFKFRRQYIIENFIVDFYCDEMKLVIEIDGDVHGYKNKAEHDKRKEDFLKARGYEVARYTNYEIYNNLENVLEDLLRKCEERKRENII